MTTDESVLAFIGRRGQSARAVAERFPGFDVMRLIRAHLVEMQPRQDAEIEGHRHESGATDSVYVLTSRGAEAVGLGESR